MVSCKRLITYMENNMTSGKLALGVLVAVSLLASCAPELPATMRAVVIGGPEAELREVPLPTVGPGQVLIEVRAAAVNPIDWKRAGGYTGVSSSYEFKEGEYQVIGSDVAGVVAARGAGVTMWQVGDEVFGSANAGYAEFVVAEADAIARKPQQMSFVEAAGLPTVTSTAWHSLIDLGKLREGQKLLIHGAAGGTGSAAVQIAKARGAYIIGTASPRNHEFLRSLGVSEVIDYNTERFEDRVSGVDLVYNTANKETAVRSIAVLKKGGMLLSLSGQPDQADCAAAEIVCGIREYENPTPRSEVYQAVAEMVEAGNYRVNVDKTWAIENFADAWAFSQEGHTRGKLVITLGDSNGD